MTFPAFLPFRESALKSSAAQNTSYTTHKKKGKH